MTLSNSVNMERTVQMTSTSSRVPTIVPSSTQGQCLPTPRDFWSKYSLKPTPKISLATTEASPITLSEERTVPMTSIDGDHMADLESDPEDVVSGNTGNLTPDVASDGEDDDDIVAARIAQDEQGCYGYDYANDGR